MYACVEQFRVITILGVNVLCTFHESDDHWLSWIMNHDLISYMFFLGGHPKYPSLVFSLLGKMGTNGGSLKWVA